MPKGHSLLEPRIKLLEAQIQALKDEMKLMQMAIDGRGVSAVVRPGPGYQPAFDRWPGNGTAR